MPCGRAPPRPGRTPSGDDQAEHRRRRRRGRHDLCVDVGLGGGLERRRNRGCGGPDRRRRGARSRMRRPGRVRHPASITGEPANDRPPGSAMNDYLPFLVLGLSAGSVYALAAMGLVVTYTTSGVFNFAHGTIGMVIAYAFVELRDQRGVPTPVALAVCLGVIAPLLGVGLDRLFRRLAGGTAANYLVASIGLLVALQGLAIIRYGAGTRQVAPLFPRRTVLTVGSLQVGFDQVAIMALALALGLAWKLFFSRSNLGLATRAVVDDPEFTGLSGTER